jgi:hypothetical protein
MFRFGCLVYFALVGFTICMGWGHNDRAALVVGSMLLWGIPLSASGLAVFVFWGRPDSIDESNDIGFTP